MAPTAIFYCLSCLFDRSAGWQSHQPSATNEASMIKQFIITCSRELFKVNLIGVFWMNYNVFVRSDHMDKMCNFARNIMCNSGGPFRHAMATNSTMNGMNQTNYKQTLYNDFSVCWGLDCYPAPEHKYKCLEIYWQTWPEQRCKAYHNAYMATNIDSNMILSTFRSYIESICSSTWFHISDP